MSATLSPPPGPRGRLLSGSLREYRADPLGFFGAMRDAHGGLVRLRMAHKTLYLVCHPDPLRRILIENADNYRKGISYTHIRKVIGDGLLTLEGDKWKRQRRLSRPAFLRANVRQVVPAMHEEVARTVERWRGYARDGRPAELFEEMTRSTFNIVGRALLGQDTDEALGKVRGALPVVLAHLYRQVNAIVPVPEWVPTSRNRRFRAALAELEQVVSGVVAQRRASGTERPDLLGAFLSARDDEADAGMDDRQLRDEVMSNLLAGHETSASGLCWIFTLLCQHPEWAERIRAEVDAVCGDRVPTAEELGRLDLTQRAVRESLRLLPPTYVYTRHSNGPDEVCGYALEGDAIVLLSQWATHRHPELWPDPLRFDPDRFRPEADATRPPLAWFPFGGGRHMCIGMDFALVEMTLVVACLLRAFDLALVPDHPVVPHPGMTLTPRHGVLVTLRERA